MTPDPRDPLASRRRSRILAAALAVACCAAPGVRAQVAIDQYINPNIPGFNVDPGVTVASRLRPDYDYRDVRVGALLIHPEVTESDGYETNVTGTASARGSALILTSASLQATANPSVGSFGAQLTVDDFRYTDVSNQSYTNWSATVGGSYNIGRDQLDVGYTHLNLNQTPRDLNVPQLGSTLAFRVDDARVNYRANFARTFIVPGVDVSLYSFDNGFAAGVPYLQSYRDRVVVAPSVQVGYELAPRRSVVFVVRDANASYSNQLSGQPSRNFNDVSVLAGVNYDVDGVIRLRLLGGYEVRTFTSAQLTTIQSPIVEASLTWTPTGLTTVTGSAARYIEDSASENLVGYTETALKLNVDHEYLRNVLFTVRGAFYRDDYQQNGGHQSLYNAGFDATWLLNRTMRLGATYDFYARQSGTATTSALNAGLGPQGQTFGFGGNYTDNRIVLQLKLGL
jgi:hypothetical protein